MSPVRVLCSADTERCAAEPRAVSCLGVPVVSCGMPARRGAGREAALFTHGAVHGVTRVVGRLRRLSLRHARLSALSVRPLTVAVRVAVLGLRQGLL